MSDNDIIKAFECCAELDCIKCPFIRDFKECDKLERSILKLIERQRAEIERLKGWDRWIVSESHAPIIKKARTEAIKEFAEELTSRIIHNNEIINRDSWFITGEINNLLKEMTGKGEKNEID